MHPHGRARARLVAALHDTVALGLPTNKELLCAVLGNVEFRAGQADTGFLTNHRFQASLPDHALAASLLAGDYGEWTGWSNNPAHSARVRFGDEVLAFKAGERKDKPVHVVEGDTVHFDGFTLRNTLYDPPQKAGAHGGDGRLAAPMNGRVVEVNAKVGQKVAAGNALIVLEAMKMEHGLELPIAVLVKAIHVQAGAQVAPGNLLLEFEPA